MIVTTLSKVPLALRGDLTKWCQEVQTGIYVGSFSARIREALWERIKKNIGSGEATLVYTTNNELGYAFETTRQDKKVVDYDGIPLMMMLKNGETAIPFGFSKASKWHCARIMRQHSGRTAAANAGRAETRIPDIVSLDIETTGLDYTKDEIISIGAVKKGEQEEQQFIRYVRIKTTIPAPIVNLTGITEAVLNDKGVSLETAIRDLDDFLNDSIIVGYSAAFDDNFLRSACRKVQHSIFKNRIVDILPIVKKDRMFLNNYKLATVLAEYQIENRHPHDALSDATATLQLAMQLIKNGKLKL